MRWHSSPLMKGLMGKRKNVLDILVIATFLSNTKGFSLQISLFKLNDYWTFDCNFDIVLKQKWNHFSLPALYLKVGHMLSVCNAWNDLMFSERGYFMLSFWVCGFSSRMWWWFDTQCSWNHPLPLPLFQVPDSSRGGKCREEESGT